MPAKPRIVIISAIIALDDVAGHLVLYRHLIERDDVELLQSMSQALDLNYRYVECELVSREGVEGQIQLDTDELEIVLSEML